MTTSQHFVLDTNVIVSALLLKQSIARQAFDKAIAQGKLLESESTIEELYIVLRRKGFDRYIGEEERLEFVFNLVREALLIEVTLHVDECRDPKDNKFLELAINGAATCIISGDNDLLVLHPFREIPILTPRQFLNQI